MDGDSAKLVLIIGLNAPERRFDVMSQIHDRVLDRLISAHTVESVGVLYHRNGEVIPMDSRGRVHGNMRAKHCKYFYLAALGLSVRADNALGRAGLRTVGDLCRLTEKEVLEFNGIGQGILGEIKQALERFGLSLKKA